MQLFDFSIYHSSDPKADTRAFGADVFVLQTCQRSLAIGMARHRVEGWEFWQGQKAYAFLLRILAGLESRILGETEVFGQFKDTWESFLGLAPNTTLQPVIQKIMSDVKRIRKEHLQNIGNSSYGTLTRRLIGETNIVTLIGAGQLAQSILPYLSHAKIHCWNRTPSRLETLKSEFPRIELIADLETTTHWHASEAVVLCTPVNANFEMRLQPHVSAKRVLHLGARKNEVEHWQSHPNFSHLDDLFSLQQEMNELKNARVKQAVIACEALAEHRYFMDGITFHHGWEDIAAFS